MSDLSCSPPELEEEILLARVRSMIDEAEAQQLSAEALYDTAKSFRADADVLYDAATSLYREATVLAARAIFELTPTSSPN